MLRTLLLVAGVSFFSVMATADVPAPQAVVIIACKVDDLTGQAGRQDPALAAKDWKDLEWHFTNGNQLECKREEVPLVDAVALKAPEIPELHPNFADFSQCAAVGMQYAPVYEKAHEGWGVMAVGCPVRITQDGPLGATIGWKLPECPTDVGGLHVTCKFDGSLI